VIDLKIEEFKPEFAGKMNFYLSAVDDLLRHPADEPSIGIILCKRRNEVIVEYALRDAAKPMGVAQYRLSPVLPDRLRGELPTAEEFARELPLMSVVELRAELERALRSLLLSRGMEPREDVGIGLALQELERLGGAPSGTGVLLEALRTMNEAVHGFEVEPGALADAVHAGNEFLAELKRLGAG